MGKRPWHAVEGALAVTPILNTAFRENPLLATAIYSAIARHHAPFSYSNGAYRLSKDAQQHTLAALPREWHDQLLVDLVTQGQKDEDINRNFVIILNDDPHEDDIAIYFAYLLIVRLLRLADQLGTSRGAKGVD
jgi:hypothetical protein